MKKEWQMLFFSSTLFQTKEVSQFKDARDYFLTFKGEKFMEFSLPQIHRLMCIDKNSHLAVSKSMVSISSKSYSSRYEEYLEKYFFLILHKKYVLGTQQKCRRSILCGGRNVPYLKLCHLTLKYKMNTRQEESMQVNIF